MIARLLAMKPPVMKRTTSGDASRFLQYRYLTLIHQICQEVLKNAPVKLK